MKILQILGPSYSGSTVLGYALNTIDGFFFGSEVKRLLRPQREGRAQRPLCDHCGQNCAYWSNEALADIGQMTKLSELYPYFGARHPEVAWFVDGSKGATFYEGSQADLKILCVKHPMRLIASTFYNERKALGIEPEEYGEFSAALAARDDLGSLIGTVAAKLRSTYEQMIEKSPEAVVFRNDKAHLKDFAEFRALERRLGVAPHSAHPEGYSRVPCHSIGGNRAPVWIAAGKLSERSKSPRNRYYAAAPALGDWRIDDKYRMLLSGAVMDRIAADPSYRASLGLLGYQHEELAVEA